MDKTFETMAYEGTIAWPMIMHLDNKDNIGPKSESAKTRVEKKRKKNLLHLMKIMQEN